MTEIVELARVFAALAQEITIGDSMGDFAHGISLVKNEMMS